MKKNLYTLLIALTVGLFLSSANAQVSITYQVDMTTAVLGAAGGTCPVPPFNPAADVVQAMGAEYNSWTEAENVACGLPFTPDAAIDFVPTVTGSMVYTKTKDITPDGFGYITWKYRINHSWDNDELRGIGDGNRHALIPTGVAAIIIASVFNDSANTITVVSGIHNPNLAEVKQVYPNPANGSAVISYLTYSNDDVKIYLSNILGQSVKTFFEGNQYVGLHSMNLNLANVPDGIYFVNVKVGNSIATQKITVLN